MRHLLLLLVALPALGATAGEPPASGAAGTLNGQVLDLVSHQPVGNVAVRLEGTPVNLTTDNDGRFSASAIVPGSYTLSAHRIGYRTVAVTGVKVVAGATTQLVLHMEPTTIELPAVSVTAERAAFEADEGLRLVIDPVRHSQAPGAFGDLLRSLRTLPSFGMANDFNGLPYARGGSPDQNSVLLDRTTIPYPYRLRSLLGGGMSAFMPEILSYVDVIPGGFSARYGNTSSAVIQLHTREGNRERRAVACHLDLLAASSVFDQPLFDGKGSLLLAARRSVIDLIGPTIAKGPYAFPRFDELFAKLSLSPAKDHRIALTFARAGEGAALATVESEAMEFSQDSRSQTAAIDWSTILSSKALLGVSLSSCTDRNWLRLSDIANEDYQAHLRYEIGQRTAGAWLFLDLGPLARLEGGTSVAESHSRVEWHANWRTPLQLPVALSCNYSPTLVGAYLQNHSHFSERVDLVLGVRADYSTLNGERLLSPRVNAVWRPTRDLRAFAAYGDFYQYPTLLSTIARNEPLIIGKAISSLKAEKATHYILGAEKEWPRSVIGKITGYVKSYSRMLLPEDLITFTARNFGEGYSAGVELSLDTPLESPSPFFFHTHYTWAQSRYRRVGSDVWIPFKWERTHSYVAQVEVKTLPALHVGFGWTYASGRPQITPGERVTHRGQASAPYSRLDMRVSYRMHLPLRKEASLYIEVFNVTNQRNIYDTTWDFHYPSGSATPTGTIYMMPRMLSLGCSAEF
ncbi:MAG: TonB-dependent receptor [Calditrichaeota bacterium]|nr:TonB-dependent receptor [Calditrichota bacterium]